MECADGCQQQGCEWEKRREKKKMAMSWWMSVRRLVERPDAEIWERGREWRTWPASSGSDSSQQQTEPTITREER